LTLNYELKTRVYPLVEAGFGGCIATLTKGPDGLCEVNSNGIFYRNSSLIWVERIGVGYRVTDRIRLIVEGRGIGFILEENLANLNSYNVGMNVEFRL